MHTPLLLDMAAGAEPDRAAIGPASDPVSYAGLEAMAQRAAAFIERSGPGEAVVFAGLNGWAFPALIFASGLIGRPIIPLNYRLPDDDLRKAAARTAPSLAVVDDDMAARFEGVEGVRIVTRSEFEAGLENAPPLAAPAELDERAVALTLFTSGTTGEPKAALLRHGHLTSYVLSTVEFMSAEPGEAALVSVPPYHIAGVSAVLTGVYSGRRIVYLPNFTPEGWVELAARERITHAMVVPTMLGRILDALDESGTELPALRALSYGGGRMPAPLIERALRRLPQVGFVNAYGLTETSSTIAVLGPEDHREALASSDPATRARLGSVGRPLPTLELEVRAPDGRVCAPGEAGEIHVRGEQVSGEYRHGRATDAEGWFATKDAGWLDEEGFLFVDGRLDDVIVRGGENISPGEIEDVLRQHEGVADVAVLGLPDAEWGETVAAVIVRAGPDVGEADLDAFVRARLRSTKTPQRWFFREALPYNETGKLLRRALKAELSGG